MLGIIRKNTIQRKSVVVVVYLILFSVHYFRRCCEFLCCIGSATLDRRNILCHEYELNYYYYYYYQPIVARIAALLHCLQVFPGRHAHGCRASTCWVCTSHHKSMQIMNI